MPRLVPDGPDIPADLIRKQEAGEMAFFCGAGISVPTGLPSFRRLVQCLYASLKISPNSGEKKLIEQEKFDEALDLLEGRLTDNAMRSEVVRLLSSTPKPRSLRLHRALLRVSCGPSGMHLVTTNYDDNFAVAKGSDDLHFHAGPTLPDLDEWDSVVHLHGRIQASPGEPVVPPLVLTFTDFGTAYLDKKWAADFVSNLMDRYTVVFVGYSMADVVVRYLTRAFTSRRVDRPTYSLVGYKDEKQRQEREVEWSGIGIHPILYHSGNDHELLVPTVEEWAKLASDPHHYRVQIALSGLKRAPDRTDHEADPDRVVWALSDPAASWPAFGRIRHTPVTGEYAARWLHEFAVRGLFSGTDQPKPYERGTAGPVITVRAEQQMLQTDSVANAVASWIEIHAHSPEVFQWVINQGHNIGFELRRRLWDRLVSGEDALPGIPPRLARLWTLLLTEPPEDAQFLLRLDSILGNLSREHTEPMDDILLRLLRPRLGVFPGPPPYRILSTDTSTREQVALLSCGHTDVILGCRDEGSRINVLAEIEPSEFPNFLRRHAVSLTEYLKTALVLLQRSDRAAGFIDFELSDAFSSDDSGMARWTGDVETNKDGATTDVRRTNKDRRRSLHSLVGTWAVLLHWVRASYRALPEDGRERDELLRHWVASSEKVLWRLALEAIEQDSAADFDLVPRILHRNAQELLWDPDCRREVLAVLGQVGTRASSELQVELLDAVQGKAGPGTPKPDSDGTILAEVGVRLASLHEGGVTLSPASLQTLATFERRRDVVHRHEAEATPVALSGRIRDVAAALRSESVDVARLREFAQRRPVAAVLALRELGESGDWPAEMWKTALDVVQTKLGDRKSGFRRSSELVEILLEIPDDLFRGLQHEIAQLLDVLAERWLGTGDKKFWHLWMHGWEHRSQQLGILSPVDPLTQALNTTAGKYTGAAMKRILAVTSTTSGRLTNEQISILDQISNDHSGSAGIVMLMFWVDWLYSNATDWTTRNIIPRMRWERATPSDELYEEVRSLWGVVAFRGSITPGLARILGSDLWKAVQHHKELHRGENLVRVFVCMSMSPPPDLIDESTCRKTAHIVIRDNPWHVGIALREVLENYDQPREEVWREFVRPWLHRFWPREKTLNTGESSFALVEAIMATGDAFPEAVNWANGYLMALNDRQIGTVCYHKNTWKPYPRAAVALLHRIVPKVGIDPWARASLVDMLNTLRGADATIPQDPRFVELEQRVAR